nr:NADH dehydrogenase subunit 4 [Ogadenus brumpti ssp. 1 BJM-2017]QLD96928.1 NADH dehydrogenase subunit 4 [Ogadenus brumpti ssp. 1 BJM-2017]UYB77906.1 NADH dehydrogenase subunit 4 [Ogadenus brumpti]UYB77919.1 NADH dehydrogenase subunit 4 [Ogadenus brumpti]
MLILCLLMMMMLSMYFYFSLLEVILGLIMIMFFLLWVMNWEGLWLNYAGEFFFLDIFSFNLIFLTLWVGLLMIIASFNSRVIAESAFFFYFLLLIFFLMVCFSSSNFLAFYLFFEGVLFPIIMMIFIWGFQPERLKAGIYMLFYTLFGSMPLLVFLLMSKISLSYLYFFWVTLNLNVVYFMMISFAFLFKIPMFLFHLWLPKAHVEAPIAGSMILAGVLLKLGVYGLLRFLVVVDKMMGKFSSLIMSVSLMGGIMISLTCLSQVDLSALIAYSSVCHMGLVLAGMFSLNVWGVYGGLLMVIGHGLCSSGLFCLANIMYERFFTRSVILLKGMGTLFPFFMMWWFFFCIVNMAAPPSMNLVGEICLMGSLVKYSLLMVIPLAFLSFFSACYSLYMFSYTQHGKGWWVMGVSSISVREYMLMLFHLFPLVLWVFKMEMFMMF